MKEKGGETTVDESLNESLDPQWDLEQIDALKVADKLLPLRSLFRHLLGQDEVQFRLRLSVVYTFREAGPFLTTNDLNRELQWIKEKKRLALIKNMKKAGWLDRLDNKGYCLSIKGRQLMRILLIFLTSITEAQEGTGLSPGTEASDIHWAFSSNTNPINALHNYKHELETVAGLVEDALSTDSWLKLYEIKDESENLIRDIGQTRQLIYKIREENEISIRDLVDTHRLLSKVLNLHAEMERRLTVYAESYISTKPGMSPKKIMDLLLEKPINELENVCENLMMIPYVPFFLVNPNHFLAETEGYLSTSLSQRLKSKWDKSENLFPEQVEIGDFHKINPQIERLFQDLSELVSVEEGVEISKVYPVDYAAESFLRQAFVAHITSPENTIDIELLKNWVITVQNEAEFLPESQTPIIEIEKGPIERISDAKLKVVKKSDL